MSTFVCSDIHGHYALFKAMMNIVDEKDTVYILGDIIDRGPESIPLLRDIMKRKNVIPIIGNHEIMMRDYYTRYDERKNIWIMSCNGGWKTRNAFSRLTKAQKQRIFDYIDDMYLQVEVKIGETTFLLSHSSFLKNEGTIKCKEVDDRTIFNTVWDSPWRFFEYIPIEEYGDDERTHVIGHVPVQSIIGPMEEPRAYINAEYPVINIDLGCARLPSAKNEWYGLCCMNLDDYANGKGKEAFRFFSY